MTKTICKKSPEKRKALSSRDPLYHCRRCRATAHKEKHLCKPEKTRCNT